MRRQRRAKIVATVGPASASHEMLRALFLAGVDTFRLNFSHGTHEDHARVHGAIRALEAEMKLPIGILQDLQGPKIRVGTIRNGNIAVEAGEAIRFVMSGADGDKTSIPLPHPEIFAAIAPGQDLLIDDGRVRVKVTDLGTDYINAKVVVAGTISNRKGVNLPGTALDLSPLTAKDRADLAFGLDLGVDWVALSFVQKPGDMIEARGLIGDRAGLMAKIEKPSALEQINDIVRLSDAVMVARGDLGVEIPHEDVPGRQKELIRCCRLAGKPVIVATQMLDSMVGAPTPTRAEVSDVATAIYDGADAVMLSAESATGRYPVEAVTMMDRIAISVERDPSYQARIHFTQTRLEATTADALAGSARQIVTTVSATAMVCYSSSGATARRIARERPPVPLLAMSASLHTSRRMGLLWGVHAVHSRDVASFEEMVEKGKRMALRHQIAKGGDRIVLMAGIPFGKAGSTNVLHVARLVGDELENYQRSKNGSGSAGQ